MKKIPLTQGKFALVDDEDFDYLSTFKWTAVKNKWTYYAVCRQGEKKGVKNKLMHRVVLGLTGKTPVADHRNHNGLDNQKSNLRVATHSENASNVSAHTDSSSKFLGVSKYRNGKYRATIIKDKKSTHLGYFESEIEAAQAYDSAAKVLHGEFANLNFKKCG